MRNQQSLIAICTSCLFLFCSYLSPLFSQSYNTDIEADLEMISQGEFFQVRGFAKNKTEFNRSLRYVFTMFTKDTLTNDEAKEEKLGRIVLSAYQKNELGTTSFSPSENQRIILLLLIYDENDRIVGKDRIVVNDDNSEEEFKRKLIQKSEVSADVVEQGKDGIEMLKGIVLENTLTKPGRDFFKKYVDEYTLKQINGEKVIEVKELLALGSNTQIQVKSDDQIIFEFYVNPRTDFIDQMVDYAIVRTNIYFQNLAKNQNLIKKY